MNQDPNSPKSNPVRKVNFRSQESGGELKMPPAVRPKGNVARSSPGVDPLRLAPGPSDDAAAAAADNGQPPVESPGEAAAPATGELTLNRLSTEQMSQRIKSPQPVLASFRPFSPPAAGYQEPRRFSSGWVALWSLTALTLGALGGYCLPKPPDKGLEDKAVRNPLPAATPPQAAPPLTRADNDELDAAYGALNTGKYAEAEKLFAALRDKHPGWESMGIEVGRAFGLQRNWSRARTALAAEIDAGRLPVEANFQLGILYAEQGEDAESNASFEKALAIDPSRADIYFYRGEILRRQGRPLEAIDKLRSALARNRNPSVGPLYRLKFWLSEIEAGQEESDGTATRINTALALPRPPMEAVFAGALRNIRAGKMQDAAALLARARQAVEPTLFSAIVHDAAFAQDNWRPELAPFLKPEVQAAE